MYRVEDLCFLLDKQRTDLMEEMKMKNKLRMTVNEEKEMDELE